MTPEGAIELEAAVVEAPPGAGPIARAARLVRRAWASWATRSLAMGAIATTLDVVTLLVAVKLLHWPNPVGAMAGVVVGGTFTFIANRLVAFTDARGTLRAQLVKFVLSTGSAMVVHAGLVYALADRLGVPVVAAKLAADVAVFSVGQMLMLRYVVFPRRAAHPADR
ncbi:MAG TPA: GtrA family protein [Myxococcales bacterium]|nr:GtrA family protein [Myxococcales bacterium]